jgi:hypothetical protein
MGRRVVGHFDGGKSGRLCRVTCETRDYRPDETPVQWAAARLPDDRVEYRAMRGVTVCDLADITRGTDESGQPYWILPTTGEKIPQPFGPDGGF